MPSHTPRSYTRINSEQLEELRALWEEGLHTLDELAERYCMSKRGVQAALARLGAVKGSKPKMRSVATPTPATSPSTTDTFTDMSQADRLAFARHIAWDHARELEALAMAVAREVAANGASVGTVKTIELAASVVSKAKNLRWAAMGLDGKLPPDAEELTELVVREITPEEIAEMRARQEREAVGGGYDADDWGDDSPTSDDDDEPEAEEEAPEPPPVERVGGDDGPLIRAGRFGRDRQQRFTGLSL